MKSLRPGEQYNVTIVDDTTQKGEIQREISYIAPFDKCNRIEDYEETWKFFQKDFLTN